MAMTHPKIEFAFVPIPALYENYTLASDCRVEDFVPARAIRGHNERKRSEW